MIVIFISSQRQIELRCTKSDLTNRHSITSGPISRTTQVNATLAQVGNLSGSKFPNSSIFLFLYMHIAVVQVYARTCLCACVHFIYERFGICVCASVRVVFMYPYISVFGCVHVFLMHMHVLLHIMRVCPSVQCLPLWEGENARVDLLTYYKEFFADC